MSEDLDEALTDATHAVMDEVASFVKEDALSSDPEFQKLKRDITAWVYSNRKDKP